MRILTCAATKMVARLCSPPGDVDRLRAGSYAELTIRAVVLVASPGCRIRSKEWSTYFGGFEGRDGAPFSGCKA